MRDQRALEKSGDATLPLSASPSHTGSWFLQAHVFFTFDAIASLCTGPARHQTCAPGRFVARTSGQKKSRHLHWSSGSNGPAKHEGTRKPTPYPNAGQLRFVDSRQAPALFRHLAGYGLPQTKKACSCGTRAGKKTDQHSRHEGCPEKITARDGQTLAKKDARLANGCADRQRSADDARGTSCLGLTEGFAVSTSDVVAMTKKTRNRAIV